VSRPLALRWEGKPVEAAFELRRPHAAVARDGGRFEAEVHADGSWVEIRGAGGPVRCAVSVSARQIWVACRGVTYVLDRAQREAARQEEAPSEDEIRAPMTGRVVRVAVPQGASVKDGDLLLTIEAMKMEFKLTAPEDGTVAEIRCAEGDRVELGQLLARLLPAAGGAGGPTGAPAGPDAT
jgi:biotin carboxyl carrier protein